jgi:hypothetical protein
LGRSAEAGHAPFGRGTRPPADVADGLGGAVGG